MVLESPVQVAREDPVVGLVVPEFGKRGLQQVQAQLEREYDTSDAVHKKQGMEAKVRSAGGKGLTGLPAICGDPCAELFLFRYLGNGKSPLQIA
jgi:hypothetical protein